VASEIRHSTETSLQHFVNNQHGFQRRGQDFDTKFAFEGGTHYTAKMFIDEFPKNGWPKRGVNKLSKKLRVTGTGTVDRRTGSGRLRSARTEGNVETVDDSVLSQEDKPQTHRTVREISWETGIHRSSVSRIICKDLCLKCFKRHRRLRFVLILALYKLVCIN